MTTWIVTIGNSDVQLKDIVIGDWGHFSSEVSSELYDKDFDPVLPAYTDEEELYTVPARVMGIVYQHQLEKSEESYDDLEFPLLDNFVCTLKETPDRIILVLTDQENISVLTDQEDKFHPKNRQSPYWQDTCTLKPILERYFQKELPDAKLYYLCLKSQAEEKKGLDDWDYTLELVDLAFSANQNSELIERSFSWDELEENETIYVSHQAGTPALSSAIQFVTLAKFRDKVQFLVSNEYDENRSQSISSSKYLDKIRLQETKAQAKKLLDRYDYAGVKEILWPKPKGAIGILLDAAIEWNQAQFGSFPSKLKKLDNEIGKTARERAKESWQWWTAYESAYLAVIRLEQGNTVEAFFHSFRAVEGLMRKWVDFNYSVKVTKKGKPYVKHPDDNQKYDCFGQQLYDFVERCWDIQPHHEDIYKFGNYNLEHTTIKERNNKFHQLGGLGEKDVFQAWQTDDQKAWKKKVLGCINFLSPEKFTSLKEASLMAKVHEALQEAIKL